jgi:hypothetical protein
MAEHSNSKTPRRTAMPFLLPDRFISLTPLVVEIAEVFSCGGATHQIPVGRNLRFSLPAGKSYSGLITDATNLVFTNLVFVFPLFEASGESWPDHSVGAMFATMKNRKSASSCYSRIALFLNAVLNCYPARFNLRV